MIFVNPWVKASVVLVIPFLAACGGSSSDPAGPTSSSDPVTISGKVMDGYLQKAQVFVDFNNNGQLDSGEPQTQSGVGGAFTLSTTADIPDDASLVAKAVAGVTVDEDTNKPVPLGYTLRAPLVLEEEPSDSSGDTEVVAATANFRASHIVSPLTTLVYREVLSNGRTVESAAAKIQADLQLGTNPMLDYVALTNSENPDEAEDARRTHFLAQVLTRLQARAESEFEGFDFENSNATLADLLNNLTGKLQNLIGSLVVEVDAALGSETPPDPDALAGSLSDGLTSAIVEGPDASSNTISGEVMFGGFVESASVFLDKNLNGVRDSGEPGTVTDENGRYSITAPSSLFSSTEVVAQLSESSTDSLGTPINGPITLYNPIGLALEPGAPGLGLLISAQLSPAISMVPRNEDRIASETQFANAVGLERIDLQSYVRRAASPDADIAEGGIKATRLNIEIGELLVRLENRYGPIDLESEGIESSQYAGLLRNYILDNVPAIVAEIETRDAPASTPPGHVLDSLDLDLSIPGLEALLVGDDPTIDDPVTEDPTTDDPTSDNPRPEFESSITLRTFSDDFSQTCRLAGEEVEIRDSAFELLETRVTDEFGYVDLNDLPSTYYITVQSVDEDFAGRPQITSNSFEVSLIDASYLVSVPSASTGTLANCEPLSYDRSSFNEFTATVSNGGSFDRVGAQVERGFAIGAAGSDSVTFGAESSVTDPDILFLGLGVGDGFSGGLPLKYSWMPGTVVTDGFVAATINTPVQSLSNPFESNLGSIVISWKPARESENSYLLYILADGGGSGVDTLTSLPTVEQGTGRLLANRSYGDSDPSSNTRWRTSFAQTIPNDGSALPAFDKEQNRPASFITGVSHTIDSVTYTLGDTPFESYAFVVSKTDTVYPSAEQLTNPTAYYIRNVYSTSVNETTPLPDIVPDNVYVSTTTGISVYSAENVSSVSFGYHTQTSLSAPTGNGAGLILNPDLGGTYLYGANYTESDLAAVIDAEFNRSTFSGTLVEDSFNKVFNAP